MLLSALSSYAILTILTLLTLLMGFIPYAPLHTQMPIWSYWELSGSIWSDLVTGTITPN